MDLTKETVGQLITAYTELIGSIVEGFEEHKRSMTQEDMEGADVKELCDEAVKIVEMRAQAYENDDVPEEVLALAKEVATENMVSECRRIAEAMSVLQEHLI